MGHALTTSPSLRLPNKIHKSRAMAGEGLAGREGATRLSIAEMPLDIRRPWSFTAASRTRVQTQRRPPREVGGYLDPESPA